ncbi:MAG: hypothetical protein NUW37_01800 [Planctomycetes bacterium]|nr:hypothetical protein [Planctomycetota bacterium]
MFAALLLALFPAIVFAEDTRETQIERLRSRHDQLAEEVGDIMRRLHEVQAELRESESENRLEQEGRISAALSLLRRTPLAEMIETASESLRQEKLFEVREQHDRIESALSELTEILEGTPPVPAPAELPSEWYRELRHIESNLDARIGKLDEMLQEASDQTSQDALSLLRQDRNFMDRLQSDLQSPESLSERQMQRYQEAAERLAPLYENSGTNEAQRVAEAYRQMAESMASGNQDAARQSFETLQQRRDEYMQALSNRVSQNFTQNGQQYQNQLRGELAEDQSQLGEIMPFVRQYENAEENQRLTQMSESFAESVRTVNEEGVINTWDSLQSTRDTIQGRAGNAGEQLITVRLTAAREWIETSLAIFADWLSRLVAFMEAQGQDAVLLYDIAGEIMDYLLARGDSAGKVLKTLLDLSQDDLRQAFRYSFSSQKIVALLLVESAANKLDAAIHGFSRWKRECEYTLIAVRESPDAYVNFPGSWFYLEYTWGIDSGFVPPWIELSMVLHWRSGFREHKGGMDKLREEMASTNPNAPVIVHMDDVLLTLREEEQIIIDTLNEVLATRMQEEE